MTDVTELAENAACSSGGAVSFVNKAENNEQQLEEIVESLSKNKRIVFKSQQINDPDLTKQEKKNILFGVLNENYSKFLLRFGEYLSSKQLKFFDMNTNQSEETEQYRTIVRDLRKKLIHKECNVKNRRFAAIKSMTVEDGYFSEKEMMRREPHLYEQLVGQFLTDAEKRTRDGIDPKDTPFSKILLDGIDRKHVENLRKQQENDDISVSSDDESSNNSEKLSTNLDGYLYPEVPLSSRRHWGDFESDDNAGVKPKAKQKQVYITGGEREILRQEFIGIMHTKFIEGNDKDFDYSKVDENSELDDLKQIDQDNEDKYFDEEEVDVTTTPMEESDDSEDDLDIYMRRLNKTLSQQVVGNLKLKTD